MRPNFVRQPCRPMLEAQMHMWGKMMPKRGETMFLARISHDPLNMVPCHYAGLDWRGCANILFTDDEPLDDRGNITVLYISKLF